MKKIFFIASLMFALISCGPPSAEPVKDEGQPVKIQVGKNTYSITRVYLGHGQGSIYVMAPDSANVETPISIGFRQGKSQSTIIQIK